MEIKDRIKEINERDKNSADKCKNMKLEDLFDTYDKLWKKESG